MEKLVASLTKEKRKTAMNEWKKMTPSFFKLDTVYITK